MFLTQAADYLLLQCSQRRGSVVLHRPPTTYCCSAVGGHHNYCCGAVRREVGVYMESPTFNHCCSAVRGAGLWYLPATNTQLQQDLSAFRRAPMCEMYNRLRA